LFGSAADKNGGLSSAVRIIGPPRVLTPENTALKRDVSTQPGPDKKAKLRVGKIMDIPNLSFHSKSLF
jgi:hypothetical protein